MSVLLFNKLARPLKLNGYKPSSTLQFSVTTLQKYKRCQKNNFIFSYPVRQVCPSTQVAIYKQIVRLFFIFFFFHLEVTSLNLIFNPSRADQYQYKHPILLALCQRFTSVNDLRRLVWYKDLVARLADNYERIPILTVQPIFLAMCYK